MLETIRQLTAPSLDLLQPLNAASATKVWKPAFDILLETLTELLKLATLQRTALLVEALAPVATAGKYSARHRSRKKLILTYIQFGGPYGA